MSREVCESRPRAADIVAACAAFVVLAVIAALT